MSHASHSLDPANADTLSATFHGDHGAECYCKVLDGKGGHALTLVVADQTIELTDEQGLDLRNQINRARLFAAHQGSLKFQALERQAKIRADEEARKRNLERQAQAEREALAARAKAKAEEARLEAEKAAAEAEAAAAVDPAQPPLAPEIPTTPVPPPPLSQPE